MNRPIQVFDGDGVLYVPPLNPVVREFGEVEVKTLGRVFGYKFVLQDGCEHWLELREEREPEKRLSYMANDYRSNTRLTKAVYDVNGITTRFDWRDDITEGGLADFILRELRDGR